MKWILAVLVAMFGGYYIVRESRMKRASVRKAVYKIIPTSLCALIGLIGAVQSGKTWPFFLFAGLGICISADWLLEFHFLRGMGAFALAHVFYCIGYLLSGPFSPASLLIFAALFGMLCLIYARIHHKLENARLILCYACILCVMASLACTRHPVLMVGALLFVLSDTMIGLGMALKISRRGYGAGIMITYYAAQLLITLSTFLST